MNDDKCLPDDAEITYRGAAPPAVVELIDPTTPHFIELPHDDCFPERPDACTRAAGRWRRRSRS